MSHSRSRRRRSVVLITAAAAALAFAAYAFTASNTVPDTKAGDGDGAITGYTVSNIDYELDASDPSKIDKVTFDLSAAAETVKVKTEAGSTTYADCTGGPITAWSCDFATNPNVVDADELRVIAVE